MDSIILSEKEQLDEDYGTLDGLYWGVLNPRAIDPEFPEVFEAMSSQILAQFVRENTEAIDRLKDGMEQLFEGMLRWDGSCFWMG